MTRSFHSIFAFGLITIGCGMLCGLEHWRLALGFFVLWSLAKIIEAT